MMQSYYSIDLLEGMTAILADVPDYQTIRVQDVQVEVMIRYMISCGCGMIPIRSVTL